MKATLTASDVAQSLGVCSAVVRQWCKSGHGPHHFRTPGGHLRFRTEDVQEWLRELEVDSREEKLPGDTA